MSKKQQKVFEAGQRVGWKKHPELSYTVVGPHAANSSRGEHRYWIANSEGHEQVVFASEIWEVK